MPDHLVDVESLVRNHSLCLYNTPGITLTSNRRCENCPGAARSPQYHQQRCPLDISNNYNLFTETAAAQAGKSDGPKSLASSSSSSDALVSTKLGQNHGISADESRSASGVLLRLNTSSPPTARFVSDDPVGRKRKADDLPESSSRNELDDRQGEEDFHKQKPCRRHESLEEDLHSLSIGANQPERLLRVEDFLSDVEEYLRNKPEVIFQDIPEEKIVLMDYRGINASTIALMHQEEIFGPSEEEQRNE